MNEEQKYNPKAGFLGKNSSGKSAKSGRGLGFQDQNLKSLSKNEVYKDNNEKGAG